MALRLQYLIMADSIQQVSEGKINILGVFDRIYMQRVPGHFAQFSIVVAIGVETEDDLGTHDIVVRFLRPGGVMTAELGGQAQLKPTAGDPWLTSLKMVMQINQMRFEEYGIHRILVLANNVEVGKHPFSVSPPPGAE